MAGVGASEVVSAIPVEAAPFHRRPVDQEVGAETPVRTVRGAVFVDQVAIPGEEQRRGDRMLPDPREDHETVAGFDDLLPYVADEAPRLHRHSLAQARLAMEPVEGREIRGRPAQDHLDPELARPADFFLDPLSAPPAEQRIWVRPKLA